MCRTRGSKLDAEGENSRQLPPPTVLVFTGGESMVVMGSGLGAYGQTAGDEQKKKRK
jgi:hypothetical protein